MNIKVSYLIVLLLFINCQSNKHYLKNNKKKLSNKQTEVAVTTNKTDLDDKELALISLQNTKWIFENYSSPVDVMDFKKPSITFTDVNASLLVFSGESFLNVFNGKFSYNTTKNVFFDKTNYKITILNTTNKKLAYLEFRFTKDLKTINSIKVYKTKLIFGLKDSMNTMIFKKM